MLLDGKFGICLVDSGKKLEGWSAPHQIGTIVKITKCEDLEMGSQFLVDTVGQYRFKINKIISPSLKKPEDYDPYTQGGHRKIWDLHEKSGIEKKMYISAEVEFIPEIEESVPTEKWKNLLGLWKSKVSGQKMPEMINPIELEQIIEQYSLTEIPTVDHIYSIAVLGANDPFELQPVLEALTMDDLFLRVRKLLAN